MTDAEAIDRAVRLKGHPRLVWLTSDANPDTESRAGYIALAREWAGAPPKPRPWADIFREWWADSVTMFAEDRAQGRQGTAGGDGPGPEVLRREIKTLNP